MHYILGVLQNQKGSVTGTSHWLEVPDSNDVAVKGLVESLKEIIDVSIVQVRAIQKLIAVQLLATRLSKLRIVSVSLATASSNGMAFLCKIYRS